MDITDHSLIVRYLSSNNFVNKRVFLSVFVNCCNDIHSDHVLNWVKLLQQLHSKEIILIHEISLLPALFYSFSRGDFGDIISLLDAVGLLDKIGNHFRDDEFHIGLLEWRAISCLVQSSPKFIAICCDKICGVCLNEMNFIVESYHNSTAELSNEKKLLIQSITSSLTAIIKNIDNLPAELVESINNSLFHCIDKLPFIKSRVDIISRPNSRLLDSDDVTLNCDDSIVVSTASWAGICTSMFAVAIQTLHGKHPWLGSRVSLGQVNSILGSDLWQFELIAQSILCRKICQENVVGVNLIGSNGDLPDIPVPTKIPLMSTSSSSKTKASQEAASSNANVKGSRRQSALPVVGSSSATRLLVQASPVTVPDARAVGSDSVWGIIQELCRTGGLRSICWGMLNQKLIVRTSSSQLLRQLVDAAVASPLPSENSLVGKEIESIKAHLFVSIVEQGLIPLLETISIGYPVLSLRSEENSFITMPLAIDCTRSEWLQYYCDTSSQVIARDAKLNPPNIIAETPRGAGDRFPEGFIRTSAAAVLDLISNRFAKSLANICQNNLPTGANDVASDSNINDSDTTLTALKDKKYRGSNAVSMKSRKTVASKSENSSAEIVRSVMFAMCLSGNSKLRTNVVFGLLFLCANHAEFARMFWEWKLPLELPIFRNELALQCNAIIDDASGGSVMRYLLASLSHDVQSMCNIVLFPMKLTLTIALQCQASSNATVMPSEALSPPISLGPTVLVLASDQQLLRMQCPGLYIVARHSEQLLELLQFELKWQINRCKELSGNETLPTDQQMLTNGISNIPITEIRQLPGSYTVWQEVFSHMLDEYIRVNSIKKMSHAEVLEAFYLSRHFRMKELELFYSKTLVSRLSISTLFPFFEAGLGLSLKPNTMRTNRPSRASSMKPQQLEQQQEALARSVITNQDGRPYLHLCQACIEFLIDNCDVVVAKGTSVPEICKLIHCCLRFIMLHNA